MIKNAAERLVFPDSYDLSKEPFKRTPIRPLGEVSNFVVQQLPTELAVIREQTYPVVQPLQAEHDKKVEAIKAKYGDTYKNTKRAEYLAEKGPLDAQLAEKIQEINRPHGQHLSAQVEALLAKRSPDKLIEALHDPKKHDVAVVDVMFLRNAIAAHAGDIGPNLQTLIVEAVGEEIVPDLTDRTRLRRVPRRIPVITYADVIYSNPIRQDPRTFMPITMQSGREELDFYETHFQIEERLERINNAAFAAIDALVTKGANGVDKAVHALQEVGFVDGHTRIQQEAKGEITDRNFVISNMERVGALRERMGRGMTRGLFDVFRTYFPDNFTDEERAMWGVVSETTEQNTPEHWYYKIKGASGKFSAGFPLLELLLSGDTLPGKRKREDSLFGYKYYAPHEQERIARAYHLVAEGNTLDALSFKLGDPPALFEVLKQIDTFILRFRGEHSKGLQQQLPAVFVGDAAGTGGEGDVPAFLKERMRKNIVRPRRTGAEITDDGTSMYL